MTNRDRIVESAKELLWERGYIGMSPRAIQERAGAGQGSMYHHFTGKADLAGVAIRQMTASFREGAERSLDLKGTPFDRLQGYMLRSREVLRGCQIGSLAQDAEIVKDDLLRRPLEETFLWLHKQIRGIVVLAQEQGEISLALEPDEVASMLIAVIQGGYVLARASGDPTQFQNAIRGAVAVLACAREVRGSNAGKGNSERVKKNTKVVAVRTGKASASKAKTARGDI